MVTGRASFGLEHFLAVSLFDELIFETGGSFDFILNCFVEFIFDSLALIFSGVDALLWDEGGSILVATLSCYWDLKGLFLQIF